MIDLVEAQKRVFGSSLRPLEKLVALALLSFWSKDSPRPWPSLPTLSAATGLSRRAVYTAIQGLVESNAISVELRRPDLKGKPVPNAKPTNHYDLGGLMSLPVHEVHANPCTSDTGAPAAPVHERTPTRARGAREPVHEVHPNKPMEEIHEERGRATRRKPKRPLPEDWKPNDQHLAKASEKGLSVDLVAAKFRNHAVANDRRQADWDAAFSNWLLNEKAATNSRRLPAPQTGMSESFRTGTFQ